MFKAFSGSRTRTHRGDPTIYNDYPQGYPPAVDFQPEPIMRSQQRVLRRPSTKASHVQHHVQTLIDPLATEKRTRKQPHWSAVTLSCFTSLYD